MIESSDPISSRQFSTFLLASESFHRYQRDLFNAAPGLPINHRKITDEFDERLDQFIEKTWYTSEDESIDSMIRKLDDFASDLVSRNAHSAAEVLQSCCAEIKRLHETKAWNVEKHVEELHKNARYWASRFFARFPGSIPRLPDRGVVVKFLPNGGPLPLMSCANRGKITFYLSSKGHPTIHLHTICGI